VGFPRTDLREIPYNILRVAVATFSEHYEGYSIPIWNNRQVIKQKTCYMKRVPSDGIVLENLGCSHCIVAKRSRKEYN